MHRLLAFAVLVSLFAAPSRAQARPALEHYNLGKGQLAIDGYDPVAYFPEGGGKPAKGKSSISLTHRGVTYRFASEANKKAFVASPERFEPTYGGWCAYAMARGKKVEVDPESFRVEDGRLLLFYDGVFNDTRKKWKKEGAAELRPKADANWIQMSGEGASRNLLHFNLKDGLALDGYDPVSYSKKAPVAGKPDVSLKHDGVTYRFANAASRDLFRKSPDVYEPLYGGYCAWAMAQGKKVEVSVESFTRDGDGTFLFYNDDKRDEWKGKKAELKAAADRNWAKLNGGS